MNNKYKDKKFISQFAYLSFVFKTFFRRPFGYIMPILYLLYLSTILLIVPAINHFGPLFIWTIGGFNIPIFNILFIAASAATLAVSVFRVSREDGTDLIFSSKPLNKRQTALIKTFVYLVIMLGISLLALFVTILIKPIFGEYNIISNPTGITTKEYQGIILSVFLGNIVNMLFFGSIAVFISMLGGQVITMIATIGLSFLLLILNFLYPITVSSATAVLSDQYNTSINSYSFCTLDQYNTDNDKAKSYAAIQCVTNDEGIEDFKYHYDTNTYWNLAKKEAHSEVTNYIDFGKQLSSLYTAFGLNIEALEEASKLSIGLNNSYKYITLKNTHVAENVEKEKYPIMCYSLTQDRGKTFPEIKIIGGNMSLEGDNWYLWSNLNQLNFNSITYLSNTEYSDHPQSVSEEIREEYENKPWTTIKDLKLSQEQQTRAKEMYQEAYEKYLEPEKHFTSCLVEVLEADTSKLFFPATWEELSNYQKYETIAKLHLYFAILGHKEQKVEIDKYCEENSIDDTFPYKSSTIISWILSQKDNTDATLYSKQKQRFIELVFTNGFSLYNGTNTFDRLVCTRMNYAETYANLYEYKVQPFYSIGGLMAAWSIISIVMFTTAIVIYKRTDFK